MKPILVMALVALAQAAGAGAQDALPPAEQLIDRYVAEVGGRDALLARTNSRATGIVSVPAMGISGSLVVESASGKTATHVEIPGLGSIRSGYDGEIAWSVDPNLGPRLLAGKELDAVRESANPLGALRDPSMFTVRETTELTEMGGEQCYKVRLVWNSGRESHDCYSVESGLLVAHMSIQESPMGAIPTTTLLEDYTWVEGMLMAKRVRQQLMGAEQIMTMETVEFDVVEPEAFDPPAAIRTLIEAARP